MKAARLIDGSTLILLGLLGCTAPPRAPQRAPQEQMLALLMPSRIEIVEPFTRVKSFDGDATPDGIELFLQAVNALDNPGLMIAGHVRVELFEYIPASGDHKGRRLEHWTIELTTAQQQRAYWNNLTQMYEFRLGIDPAKIPRAEKYVLAVTLQPPLGKRLADEYVMSERAMSPLLRAERQVGG